uniref:Uncharacterized protein n=1 Tax=Anguilla anguilla TaxID=7936 RepID=A0A0E9RTJ7_ANGAN
MFCCLPSVSHIRWKVLLRKYNTCNVIYFNSPQINILVSTLLYLKLLQHKKSMLEINM